MLPNKSPSKRDGHLWVWGLSRQQLGPLLGGWLRPLTGLSASGEAAPCRTWMWPALCPLWPLSSHSRPFYTSISHLGRRKSKWELGKSVQTLMNSFPSLLLPWQPAGNTVSRAWGTQTWMGVGGCPAGLLPTRLPPPWPPGSLSNSHHHCHRNHHSSFCTAWEQCPRKLWWWGR